jgi:hypothetical protein
MTETLSIVQALNQVMNDVQAVSKSQRVTSGPAQFNFRGVDQVVNVVGPALRKHGVIVVPHSVEEIREERYTTAKGSGMHGVILRIGWRFYGPDGSFIEASSVGESADSGDKASPKAHSVAYRTVLLQALCIPTDEVDPDSQVHERESDEERESRQRAETQQFIATFTRRIGEADTKPRVLSMYGELLNRHKAGVITADDGKELKALLDEREKQLATEEQQEVPA